MLSADDSYWSGLYWFFFEKGGRSGLSKFYETFSSNGNFWDEKELSSHFYFSSQFELSEYLSLLFVIFILFFSLKILKEVLKLEGNFDFFFSQFDLFEENISFFHFFHRYSEIQITSGDSRKEFLIQFYHSQKKKWKIYPFKYKPFLPSALSRFVPFHLPRLDYSFYFLQFQKQSFIYLLLLQILKKSPSVLALLASPKKNYDIKYLRFFQVSFSFTELISLEDTSDWWKIHSVPLQDTPLIYTLDQKGSELLTVSKVEEEK